MTQTILKETDTALRLIPPESSESRQGRNRTQGATLPPPNTEDLIPYSAKDLKYMWTLWDEAQRHHQPGRRLVLPEISAPPKTLRPVGVRVWPSP
jgi:hypothetical protein